MKIHARAESAGDLDRLELNRKGTIVKTAAAPAQTRVLTTEMELPAVETGWVEARLFEKPAVSLRFAHTSSVCVQVGSDRGIVAEDARYFMGLMEVQVKFYERLPLKAPGASGTASAPGGDRKGSAAETLHFQNEAHRKATLDLFRRARQIYAQLALQ